MSNACVLWCLVQGDQEAPFSVGCLDTVETNIDDLKVLIKQRMDERFPSKNLTLWEPKGVIPVEPSETLGERVKNQGTDLAQFAERLDEATSIAEEFKNVNQKCAQLNVIIRLPVRGLRKRPRSRSADSANPTSSDLLWLTEVHTKIWKKEEFGSLLFREVEVTYSDYTALQKTLKNQHPDRDKSDYNGSDTDVLTVKLDYLRSRPSAKAPSAKAPKASSTRASKALPADVSSSRDPDPNDDEVSEASNEENTVIKSLFPFLLSYLDLSPLGLKEKTGRFQSPLLYRKEYKYISELIEKRPQGRRGSVLVSGQPGVGKTMYLFLRVIEKMIEGRPFLYYGSSGTLYHVSEKGVDVAQPSLWSSKEIIVALVDGDANHAPSHMIMLIHDSVQLIVASSPKVSSEKWIKQVGTVTKLAMDLWSQKELFLTWIFLHQYDSPFKWLWDSSSYFGYNPRQCFRASSSVLDLNAEKDDIKSVIRDAAWRTDFVELFRSTQSGINVFSHRIFQISSPDTKRLLSNCHFEPISRWAFDLLLDKYEEKKSDATADFYFTLSGMTDAATLRGHLFERQVLRYLFRADYRSSIRQLTNSNEITLSGDKAIRRVNFEDSTISNELTDAVRKQEPVHLVPSARDFAAVDSILYNPNDRDAVLTCIQITMNLEHHISVKDLIEIQGWLQGDPLENLHPSKKTPWRFVFVVPTRNASKFICQKLDGDTSKGEWAGKVRQYVLGLEEGTIFGPRSNPIVQHATTSQLMMEVD